MEITRNLWRKPHSASGRRGITNWKSEAYRVRSAGFRKDANSSSPAPGSTCRRRHSCRVSSGNFAPPDFRKPRYFSTAPASPGGLSATARPRRRCRWHICKRRTRCRSAGCAGIPAPAADRSRRASPKYALKQLAVFAFESVERQGVARFLDRVDDLFEFGKHGLPKERAADVVDLPVDDVGPHLSDRSSAREENASAALR